MNLISVIIYLIILIFGVWVLYRGYKKGMEFGKFQYAFIVCLSALFICLLYSLFN
ncbi:hypothetical protein mru_0093 [Methanobrevibacter ruminantium M1]|uniref:Uncharacterized protein n=1 Tax=Methanobrevibacter ruminantium (strain ATCC 35063 / DSM 1093 / JCM 13430 / OCM 146 / M1) TaxID=634498 RepID=D3DYM5_METRM|nr:hypothetical protein [Methanobrevibacter ruminantium]ADC45945.1 hypothetical protein mru_0093 [Methanobrevibacter ruminantium M1]